MDQAGVPELCLVLIKHGTSDVLIYKDLLVLFSADSHKLEYKKAREGLQPC